MDDLDAKILADIVELKGRGYSHAQMSDQLSRKYGIDLTKSAVRGRWRRRPRRIDPPQKQRNRIPERYLFETGFPSDKNVLVIGDTHHPFTHKKYLDFVLRIRDKYKCTTVVHIGDVVDQHALSQWDHDPDGFAAGPERIAALRDLQDWYREFPDVKVCIGNHDSRIHTLAKKRGIPQAYLQLYEEVWEAPPGWKWGLAWKSNGVIYEHGTGSSGKLAAYNRCRDAGGSLVMGHIHTNPGVSWVTTTEKSFFGMNAGCGIDSSMYAMAYARPWRVRPTLGCGVVLDYGAEPHFIRMKE